MTPSHPHPHPHKKSCETLCLSLDSVGGVGGGRELRVSISVFFLPLWVLVRVLEVSPSPSHIFFLKIPLVNQDLDFQAV